MSIFDHTDYRSYLRERQKSLPRNGWGFVTKLAEHLRVGQVKVSQILGGSTDFTLDQAMLVADFLALTELERDYFTWMVIRARSGSKNLEDFSDLHLAKLRERANRFAERFPGDRALDDSQQATFYSNYLYSAIRLFTSIGKGKTLEEIIDYFHISRTTALKILEFLVSAGLCDLAKDRYTMGISRTAVTRGSPHILKHQTNWRLLALNSAEYLRKEEIMLTAPVSLSRKDYAWAIEKLRAVMDEILKQVQDSEAEMVVCWNLDWFELKDRS